MRSKALEKAIEKAGGVNALGRALGISGQAVQQWEEPPAERVVEIERVTGVSRAALRPDLFVGMDSRS